MSSIAQGHSEVLKELRSGWEETRSTGRGVPMKLTGIGPTIVIGLITSLQPSEHKSFGAGHQIYSYHHYLGRS